MNLDISSNHVLLEWTDCVFQFIQIMATMPKKDLKLKDVINWKT